MIFLSHIFTPFARGVRIGLVRSLVGSPDRPRYNLSVPGVSPILTMGKLGCGQADPEVQPLVVGKLRAATS
jgi:hypothetical protein